MPSEFNHIDDLIRRKEAETSPDNSFQDRHWKQMQQMLAGKAPLGKVSAISKKLLTVIAGSVVIVSAVLFFVLKEKDHSAGPVPPVVQQQDAAAPALPDINPIVTDTNNSQTTTSSAGIDAGMSLHVGTFPPLRTVSTNDKEDPENVQSNPSLQLPPADPRIVLESFFNRLTKNTQEFIIRTNRDTTIICKEGTRIFIPANSFQLNGNPATGNVTFRVKEFYEMADIIGNKLTTTSDHDIIATGGMLHLEVMQGDHTLDLAKNVKLEVHMPSEKFDPAMQLFYGEVLDDTEADSIAHTRKIDWQPAHPVAPFVNEKQLVKVLDVLNDPRSVKKVRGKYIAKFIVSHDSKVSLEVIKKELQQRYGHLYDEIKVRRGWKENTNRSLQPVIPEEILKKAEEGNQDPWNTAFDRQSRDGLVGDVIEIPLLQARALGLISSADASGIGNITQDMVVNIANDTEAYNIGDSARFNDFQSLMAYRFQLERLGWINCDKYLAGQGVEFGSFSVDRGPEFQKTYMQSFLVFERYNAVVSGRWSSYGSILFTVPMNEKAHLLLVGVHEGKVVYCMKEIVTSETEISNLQFIPTTPEDFRKLLTQFGNVQND